MKISHGLHYAFENIMIGGLFNTPIARCVKTSESEAIVVMDGALNVGAKIEFKPDDPCLLLWPKLSEGRHIEIPICCTHHSACDCRQAIVNRGVELVCRESMVALEKIEDAPCD